jgi:MFS family permease
MAGLALLGLFAALYHPIGLALVPELAARTGRALAVNGVFGNLGLAAAAAVTGVLAQYGGWQNAFLAPGVAGLVVGGLLLLRRWRLGAAATHAAVKSRVAGEAIVRRTQINVFAVVCVAALFGGFVFNAVTVSMPKFFDERLVMLAGDLTWIGASTGIVFGIAAFAQLASGELLDRFGARPVLICLVSGQIVLLVCLSLVEGWAVVPLALLAVILIFAEIPITTWLLGRYVQSGLRSRAVSVEYVLALGVGSAVVPIIAAMHGIGLGFDIQFLALGACATMVFTAAWFLPRLRNN